MALRKLALVLALALLALPSFVIAEAEHRATVLMRNGDRVSGNLDGVGNGSVYVRLSQSDQRKLPIGDVLVIDLVGGASGLPDTETSVAARADHLMLLRDGSSMTGRFTGTVGGNEAEPHQVVFNTNGQERRIGLDQVARIYMGNYPATSTASSSTSTPTNIPAGAIRIPANATWVPTNIVVRQGDRLVFNVTGQVQLSDDGGDIATAGGSHRGRRTQSAPIPNALAGALIAKVGNSAPFGIGDQTAAISMPARGMLYLGVNDDHVNDNRGEFVVEIQHIGTRQR
jgi:hypothetical protein